MDPQQAQLKRSAHLSLLSTLTQGDSKPREQEDPPLVPKSRRTLPKPESRLDATPNEAPAEHVAERSQPQQASVRVEITRDNCPRSAPDGRLEHLAPERDAATAGPASGVNLWDDIEPRSRPRPRTAIAELARPLVGCDVTLDTRQTMSNSSEEPTVPVQARRSSNRFRATASFPVINEDTISSFPIVEDDESEDRRPSSWMRQEDSRQGQARDQQLQRSDALATMRVLGSDDPASLLGGQGLTTPLIPHVDEPKHDRRPQKPKRWRGGLRHKKSRVATEQQPEAFSEGLQVENANGNPTDGPAKSKRTDSKGKRSRRVSTGALSSRTILSALIPGGTKSDETTCTYTTDTDTSVTRTIVCPVSPPSLFAMRSLSNLRSRYLSLSRSASPASPSVYDIVDRAYTSDSERGIEVVVSKVQMTYREELWGECIQ